jgi:uncharacterized peroxidase-related enzyme
MPQFEVHSPATAPAAAKALLENSQQLYGGRVPNLHGIMAEAPTLLEAYQALNEIFARTSLSTVERNIVWLAINYVNECTYCMAAHSVVAKHAGMSEEDIDALRTGEPLAHARHETLRAFTAHLVETRGWADQERIDTLLAAGYDKATILEVILAIGMKTLSNYTNHVADTPLDPVFRQYAWQKP